MTDAVPSLWRKLSNTRLRDILRARLNSSLDWRHAIESANLPPELADAVKKVVGRTRLWRREKVDVATDLVGHFQDGLEAGRTPAELLESFGNSKMAGVLIGRSKKRGRSLGWHLWQIGWMSAVLLLFAYVAIGFWMSASRPTVNVDYVAAINKSASEVTVKESAWPIYRDALLALGPDLPLGSSPTSSPYNEPWIAGTTDSKELEQVLADHPDAIAQLRAAARLPHLGFVTSTSFANFSEADRKLFKVTLTPEQTEAAKNATLADRWLISTLIPHELYLRSSAELLAASARRSASAGDNKTAFEDIVSLFGISRHCEETPLLVCTLTAAAVQRTACRTIQAVLIDHPNLWSDDQLRNLAHELAASRIGWRRGIEGERSGFYDIVQRIYTDNGNGDGRLALHVTPDRNLFELLDSIGGTHDASVFANPGIALFSLPAANMVVGSRKEMTEAYEHITNEAIARVDQPYWERSGKPSLDEGLRSLRDGPLGQFRHFLVLLVTPAYDNVLNKATISDAERDGVLLGLAIELHHRKQGKWPESLDSLSPQWIPAVPPDPITGKPLHFKIVDYRPIVYSVGIDRDDDGGQLPNNAPGQSHPASAAPAVFEHHREALQAPDTDGDWILWTTQQPKS